MKKVYISHPLRGDTDRTRPDYKAIAGNMESVDKICRWIAETHKHPAVLPLSPINAFSFLKVFSDDEKALEMCLEFLELADELWVFGDWEKSEGCRMEIERARKLRIPIIYETGETELPKSFYCAETYGACLTDAVVRAWNVDQAKELLNCSEECMEMCGCGGPSDCEGYSDEC